MTFVCLWDFPSLLDERQAKRGVAQAAAPSLCHCHSLWAQLEVSVSFHSMSELSKRDWLSIPPFELILFSTHSGIAFVLSFRIYSGEICFFYFLFYFDQPPSINQCSYL